MKRLVVVLSGGLFMAAAALLGPRGVSDAALPQTNYLGRITAVDAERGTAVVAAEKYQWFGGEWKECAFEACGFDTTADNLGCPDFEACR